MGSERACLCGLPWNRIKIGRILSDFGDGVRVLWGCMAVGFGVASSESDRIALILSDFGEGCSKRFLGVGIW